ncbi:MAG TPA: hypothetical protein VGA65_03430 [Hyphomicrobium sp.]
MDVMQVSDVSAGAGSLGDWLALHWKDVATYTAVILLGWFIVARVGKPVWRRIEETILSNWRLALLGTTALVLSLASGWTTWDGMRNFTQEPLLSLMITFGIQGVMLIVAWLIGESFATGMNQQASASAPRGLNRGVQAAIGLATGTLLFFAVMAIVLQGTGTVDWRDTGTSDLSWSNLGDKLLLAVVGLLIFALIVVYATSDIIKPYLQGSRVILKNAVLWVMFLACMTTSVFFSFDSLFTAIFPQSERVRAAELRAQNQVAGIVADIGQTIDRRSAHEAEALFTSAGWQAYDTQLTKLAKAAQGAQGEIERYFNEQVEAKNRAVKEQQERIATARGSQAGLAAKKGSITDERARLAAERPGLAADYAQKKNDLDARARQVDAKRVEAMAEGKGVEGTLKEGRGPVYRQRMDELYKLQGAYKIAEERTNNAKKRLDSVETRLAAIDRELAAIDGDLATYQAEAQTAEQRIQLAQGASSGEEVQRLDPARILTGFEAAKAEFRQKPNVEHLASLQQQCSQLLGAMASTQATKEKVRGIDCDPKQASEAAALMFALNMGARTFAAGCAGGEKLESTKGADQLFGFARKCLVDSGLPSQETDALRTKINTAELNRDDKAHRFVVTWNAFEDGNRLAYLALSIAIAIDTLVFMSGLFGANAVRSPLSDVPSFKARTAQQLEAIVENALLPDTFETARVTLQSLRPITNVSGFMAEVRPEQLDPHTAARVLGVLNAGATIHAVEYDEVKRRYLVRSELFEFLSVVAKKAFEASAHHVSLAELEKVVGVALLPNLSHNAETVLHYMHPISEDRGFTAEIKLGEVAPDHLRTVRNTLNAGATLDRVQRAGKDATHYFIHRDLYRTLALIRARTLMTGYGQQQIGGGGQGERFGGSITEDSRALEDHAERHKQLPPVAANEDNADAESAHDLRQRFVSQLLQALRLDPASYNRVDGEAFAAAVAANEAFVRARRANPILDQELTERDEQAHMSLDQAYTLLKSKLHPSDGLELQLLKGAYDEIDQGWPVLMLLPNGPFESVLKELVDMLEADAGDGRLPAEQDDLYQIAKALTDAFKANSRTNELSWRRLEASFNQAPRGGDPRVAFDDGGRTLN